MITIESIIKKLGFDPRKDDDYDWWKKLDGYTCDDSKPNPFSVLTREESKFLRDTFNCDHAITSIFIPMSSSLFRIRSSSLF